MDEKSIFATWVFLFAQLFTRETASCDSRRADLAVCGRAVEQSYVMEVESGPVRTPTLTRLEVTRGTTHIFFLWTSTWTHDAVGLLDLGLMAEMWSFVVCSVRWVLSVVEFNGWLSVDQLSLAIRPRGSAMSSSETRNNNLKHSERTNTWQDFSFSEL